MEIGRDGWRSNTGRRREGRVRLRERQDLKDGWIGGESEGGRWKKKARVGGVGEEMAELSV